MKRKPNRLDLNNYHNYHIYYLTINCFNRANLFSNPNTVSDCLAALKTISIKFEAKIWAYCFMPDHLHLLVETENCLKMIKFFKQVTGFGFKKHSGSNLWQKSYYDHILRKEESLIGTIKYILSNPVRAELVQDYLAYPHSGSFEIDIADFVET